MLDGRQATLGISLTGSSGGAARLQGLEPLPGKVNDLRAARSRWRTGIATYARVQAAEVHPGIDVVYYGNGRDLEFDLEVAPGVDPGAVRLHLAGADAIAVDAAGDLHVTIVGGDGEVVLRAPVVYQESAAERTPVESRYRVAGPGEVAFELCGFDPGATVVIDPVIAYSTYLGGSLDDQGYGIAVDAAGSAYVVGYTKSLDFPTPGALQPALGGGTDGFVTKLAADGGSLVWSTYLGGSGGDWASGIAIDAGGSAYVAGHTDSTDFPPTPNGFQQSRAGGTDAFLCRLSPAGDDLLYSTYYGGTASESLSPAVRLGPSGTAYLAGDTTSKNLPTTATAYSRKLKGTRNAYLARFNTAAASGPASLLYATYFGGGSQSRSGLGFDASGAYLAGHTTAAAPGLPTTSGAFDRSHNGGQDSYVAKINPAVAGTAGLVYSTFLGGSGDDWVSGALEVNPAGQAFVAGATGSVNFPTTGGAFDTSLEGSQDAYVTRLNAAGSALLYSTYLGGENITFGEGANSVAIDLSPDPLKNNQPRGTAVVVGMTTSADWPLTGDAIDPTYRGSPDAFLVELDTDASGGASLVYSSYLGGTTPANNDGAEGVAVSAAGDWYVTGLTFADDFPTTPGAFQPARAGGRDGYVVKRSR